MIKTVMENRLRHLNKHFVIESSLNINNKSK